jgi:putative Mg2+ transporter-C (MgtC) family protein
MSITLEWQDIALRLVLTIIAGSLIGFNRGGQGHAAGLRTTLLVCLAASVAMIQTNLLIGTRGKAADSFVSIDVMRLPLGILSGMGFIGGGVILKRENLVLGVTTAATLWFVTVIGLCFGGGQLVLGSVTVVLGLAVLWGLKLVEQRIPQNHQADLLVTIGLDGPTEEDVRHRILAAGFRFRAIGMMYDALTERRELLCDVSWRGLPGENQPPAFLKEIAALPGVSGLKWTPQGMPAGFE